MSEDRPAAIGIKHRVWQAGDTQGIDRRDAAGQRGAGESGLVKSYRLADGNAGQGLFLNQQLGSPGAVVDDSAERQLAVHPGARVQAFDPTVDAPRAGLPDDIHIAKDALAATEGATVLAVLTEWDDFRWIAAADVAARMAGRSVVDGRNLLDRNDWRHHGFGYVGIGRG